MQRTKVASRYTLPVHTQMLDLFIAFQIGPGFLACFSGSTVSKYSSLAKKEGDSKLDQWFVIQVLFIKILRKSWEHNDHKHN